MTFKMILTGFVFVLAYFALREKTKDDVLAIIVALVVYALFCFAVGKVNV